MRLVRWVLLGLLVALTVAGAVRSARVNGVETQIVREPAIATAAAASAAAASAGPSAPEFPHTDADAWINSPPLRMSALRGKVVLLDVWTFG